MQFNLIPVHAFQTHKNENQTSGPQAVVVSTVPDAWINIKNVNDNIFQIRLHQVLNTTYSNVFNAFSLLDWVIVIWPTNCTVYQLLVFSVCPMLDTYVEFVETYWSYHM